MTEPSTAPPKPAFTPEHLDALKRLGDVVDQYVRGFGDAMSQLVKNLETEVLHQAMRIEVLDRLLVAKGLVGAEELRDALSALEVERMVDRVFDPPGEARDADGEDGGAR